MGERGKYAREHRVALIRLELGESVERVGKIPSVNVQLRGLFCARKIEIDQVGRD